MLQLLLLPRVLVQLDESGSYLFRETQSIHAAEHSTCGVMRWRSVLPSAPTQMCHVYSTVRNENGCRCLIFLAYSLCACFPLSVDINVIVLEVNKHRPVGRYARGGIVEIEWAAATCSSSRHDQTRVSVRSVRKYYSVARGYKLGLYTTWVECRPMVKGFRGARFKGCKTLAYAEAFLVNYD
ncbi:uncharacterized protein [Physcomitrium patens]|uniref:uncharacterized protein n=1 Tax=Physcomitrium patens TaxID=3218 RepID=UPI003CCD8F57